MLRTRMSKTRIPLIVIRYILYQFLDIKEQIKIEIDKIEQDLSQFCTKEQFNSVPSFDNSNMLN